MNTRSVVIVIVAVVLWFVHIYGVVEAGNVLNNRPHNLNTISERKQTMEHNKQIGKFFSIFDPLIY